MYSSQTPYALHPSEARTGAASKEVDDEYIVTMSTSHRFVQDDTLICRLEEAYVASEKAMYSSQTP